MTWKPEDTPFTVVEGVPREMLAKAIKQTALAMADTAKQELSSAIGDLYQAAHNPRDEQGVYMKYPDPDKVEAEWKAFGEAIARYRDAYDRATRAAAQARDLVTPSEDGEGA